MGILCRANGNLHGLFAGRVSVAGGVGVAVSGEDYSAGRFVGTSNAALAVWVLWRGDWKCW